MEGKVKQAKKWNLEPMGAEAKLALGWTGNWLVLRCPNNRTVPLVAALVLHNIQAWTPMWVRQRRYPRSSNSRKILLPCLPSFIFLAESDAIRALAASEGNGVPQFSFMKSYGMLVRIKDQDLEGLRKVADLNPRKANPIKCPAIGERRKIISGSFQGLDGIVRGHTKHHCLFELEAPGAMVLKLPPFLLSEIEA